MKDKKLEDFLPKKNNSYSKVISNSQNNSKNNRGTCR